MEERTELVRIQGRVIEQKIRVDFADQEKIMTVVDYEPLGRSKEHLLIVRDTPLAMVGDNVEIVIYEKSEGAE